ncbi:MAG: STAS domain-containing protein [Oligoflexia bacterium]|nr:STAS domain-containing protein [Oligoflexia bacterium]
MVKVSFNADRQKSKLFKYNIEEKIEENLLIIIFSGEMSEGANSIINQCQREINSKDRYKDKDIKYVILDFNEVTLLNEEIIGSIRGLQSAIRKKNALIRVCCLRPEWKKMFFDEDIFHKDEIGEGRSTTIDGLKSKMKKDDLYCNSHL